MLALRNCLGKQIYTHSYFVSINQCLSLDGDVLIYSKMFSELLALFFYPKFGILNFSQLPFLFLPVSRHLQKW